ncbi:hypothetical protein B0I35DRAFT_437468 [Stachybotrys elegans]|uniref:PIN domain-containing protein n=1 Tax=Stachybotrys elegans TaxID=80388 RepID=A0A8K0SMY9_9HYPO|nr:hypothetical protein B0I35DRAFT_437468 [Stachybotrys elegans]
MIVMCIHFALSTSWCTEVSMYSGPEALTAICAKNRSIPIITDDRNVSRMSPTRLEVSLHADQMSASVPLIMEAKISLGHPDTT